MAHIWNEIERQLTKFTYELYNIIKKLIQYKLL